MKYLLSVSVNQYKKKWMDVITDVMRSSIKKKEKERENLEATGEVCKPFPNHILEVFLFFSFFFLVL